MPEADGTDSDRNKTVWMIVRFSSAGDGNSNTMS